MQIADNGKTITIQAQELVKTDSGKCPDFSRALMYAAGKMNEGFYLESISEDYKTEGPLTHHQLSITLCGRDRFDAL